ncbi:D-alanine--D-alanine ligase [Candidatus Uhrbacteria bacterium CG10_big_fil_rev_8_21_14_0_10_48_11]|uniref:D-alanine--D-alanine ligase n=1 Tax=Candidatus Uhrbacteria bacterium CG10_big_fil_rev_8_21_14_0_10_48_11 TaxID=1975037 RepID=A0A2M8LDS6_9BACT|nr:MAG: D-alanine--D-alanine ligase [Candidatus Uhrbacteria bacterium CG10_big_fil_rev_8_21_14_0_10_48_11]
MTAEKKINLALIYGGKSTEHEVSLRSARSIYEKLDKDKYNVVLLGVSQSGRWLLADEAANLLTETTVSESNSRQVVPTGKGAMSLVAAESGNELEAIDVVFPIIHGAGGEDGSLQGMLELLDVPYVGCGVLGSAVGMDKDVTKRLLRDAGVEVAPYATLRSTDSWQAELDAIVATLHYPLFVKPANLGSSVGITKVKIREALEVAVADAFTFDQKVLIEKAIEGREIEVAVLGNEKPEASVPGEILPHHEFYSYEAKYVDEHGASLSLPAKLSTSETEEVRMLACRIFKTLELSGMARVDFFLTQDGRWICNEVNSPPGFTTISMYPKLWEISGVPFTELLDRLIALAVEKKKAQRKLRRQYQH